MAAPLYFLKNIRREQLAPRGDVVLSILNDRGLGDVFGDCVRSPEHVMLSNVDRGPGDASGVVVAASATEPRRFGYYHDVQTWTQWQDGLWIGVDRTDRPTPDDLARPERIAGYPVPLGDGHTWTVPILRRQDDSTCLPSDMVPTADGRVLTPVKSRYRDLWEASADDVAFCFADEGPSSEKQFAKENMPEMLARCVRILGVNYRFGLIEQSILGVVDTSNWYTILACSVDVPLYQSVEAAQKKSGDP